MNTPTEAERQHIADMAIAAERLRSEPAFQQAVLTMRKEAVEAMIAADPTNADAIRTHQATIRAIDGLCGEIAGMIHRATPRQSPAVA